MINGRLDDLHLGDLLQWFKMAGLSGRLTLEGRPWKQHLDLVDGRIVYVSSEKPHQRLGSWLAAEGVAPPSVLRRCLGLSLLRRTLFSGELIDKGGVGIESLKQSIGDLARIVIGETLAAGVSDFAFDSTYPVGDLLGLDLDLDPNTLLLDAARKMDEGRVDREVLEEAAIPVTGAQFEAFFWDLLTVAVPKDDPVHGAEIADLHDIVQHVMRTLADWVATSPGLVPWPSSQVTEVDDQLADGETINLDGLSHATWNQMVLACAVRVPSGCVPEDMAGLARAAEEIDLWEELVGAERLCRPETPRLDMLTASSVKEWACGARAAAPHLGVDPGVATLAVHLMVVPTDLVLWVLTSLPISHNGVRKALLAALPPRIGKGLATRADFPAIFSDLLGGPTVCSLAAALHLGRKVLANSAPWPVTVSSKDEDRLLDFVSGERLSSATRAVSDAAEERA